MNMRLWTLPALMALALVACDAAYEPVPLKVREGLESYDEGRFAEALDSFRDAGIEDPNDGRISLDIGSALYRQDSLEQAGEEFARALVGDDAGLRAGAAYGVGNAQFRQQQLAQAVESYERVLEIDPDDMDAKFNLELAQLLLNQAAQNAEDQEQQEQDRRISDWARERVRRAEEFARARRYADARRLMQRTIDAEPLVGERYGDFTNRLGDLSRIFDGVTP